MLSTILSYHVYLNFGWDCSVHPLDSLHLTQLKPDMFKMKILFPPANLFSFSIHGPPHSHGGHSNIDSTSISSSIQVLLILLVLDFKK